MSRSLNKVQLIGHVGKDPELQESTEWHTIVVWNSQYRNLADIVHKMVQKGSRIYVEGKLKYRTFEGRDGSKKTVTEIIADSIILLDAKPASSENTPSIFHEEHNEE